MLRVVCVVDQEYRFAVVEVSTTEGCDAFRLAEPFKLITGIAGAVSNVTVLLVDVAKHAGPA
jgi:hypothetical protein